MKARDNQLAMLPGDVTTFSLFDPPPVVAPASTPTVEPERCAACHGRTDDRSPRCLCAIQPEGPARALALVPDVDDHQDHDPAAARRARIVAHRERCPGVLMSPVFGIGRVSCGVCDFGPDDA